MTHEWQAQTHKDSITHTPRLISWKTLLCIDHTVLCQMQWYKFIFYNQRWPPVTSWYEKHITSSSTLLLIQRWWNSLQKQFSYLGQILAPGEEQRSRNTAAFTSLYWTENINLALFISIHYTWTHALKLLADLRSVFQLDSWNRVIHWLKLQTLPPNTSTCTSASLHCDKSLTKKPPLMQTSMHSLRERFLLQPVSSDSFATIRHHVLASLLAGRRVPWLGCNLM